MRYSHYAKPNDYEKYNLSSLDNVEVALINASHHIDTLTFNRIVKRGFDNLTEWQREIITEAACRLAEFEAVNQEMLQSTVSGYSINGVSIKYDGGWTTKVINGIPIRQDIYELLAQTGLCTLRMGAIV